MQRAAQSNRATVVNPTHGTGLTMGSRWTRNPTQRKTAPRSLLHWAGLQWAVVESTTESAGSAD
eukprot:11223993-Lingulodinium_polyedra.AAC.1